MLSFYGHVEELEWSLAAASEVGNVAWNRLLSASLLFSSHSSPTRPDGSARRL